MANNLTASTVHIKVQPALLIQKAQSITASLTRLRQEFADMDNIMVGTVHYWNGEAAELYRECQKKLTTLADDMFLRIKEHAEDLQNIASVYTTAENTVQKQNSALPVNTIK